MTDYGQNFHVKKYSTSFVAISWNTRKLWIGE
jgi:hypothetical protein